MDDKPKDTNHCFKCGRHLGPKLEWKKMETEEGPICYVCFNRESATAETVGDTRIKGGKKNA